MKEFAARSAACLPPPAAPTVAADTPAATGLRAAFKRFMAHLSRRRPGWLAGFAALHFACALPAAGAAELLIDTGPGGTSSIGAVSLFAAGSTTCSPQPQCANAFQYLAARFTLKQAATLESFEAWLGPFGTGGQIEVKIRAEVNGLPAVNPPPLFSPNSIYSKTYTLPNSGAAGWAQFTDYAAVLAAGTYWLTLEPVAGSGLNYNMPGGAARPLAKYAFFGNDNPGYLALPNASLGIRVWGTNFPGIAFGTATRTILNGSVFGCCPVGPYDFIRAGSRDFSRLGVEGETLTSSYIFAIPAGFTHGRGKLIENGLSTGAYAFMSGPCSGGGSCARGAGRGVAFRTYVNMSDAARTFRVNAVLRGAFFNAGGVAAAGVYAFDTAGFANAINASGLTYARYLLRRDGLAELAAGGTSLSLETLFPGAVLASDFELPAYPVGVVGTTPLATGLLTLPPGGTVTVMFDLATYARDAGAVNFGDTLEPAANLFTDADGNPVLDVVGVGPSAEATAPVAALALTPATASNPVGTPHSLSVTATDAAGQPVVDAPVDFVVTAGPNAGLSVSASTDAEGKVGFDYTSETAGTDTIEARSGAVVSNAVAASWQSPTVAVCPQPRTYWRSNHQLWPVASLTLGNRSYGKLALLAILYAPAKLDASLILATQLAAAKLNVANGADAAPIQATLTAADALLGAFPGWLPYGVKPTSATGRQMVQAAATLESYNGGALTPGCAP